MENILPKSFDYYGGVDIGYTWWSRKIHPPGSDNWKYWQSEQYKTNCIEVERLYKKDDDAREARRGEFKHDLFALFEVLDNPKVDLCYQLACEYANKIDNEYQDMGDEIKYILSCFRDLVTLIK